MTTLTLRCAELLGIPTKDIPLEGVRLDVPLECAKWFDLADPAHIEEVFARDGKSESGVVWLGRLIAAAQAGTLKLPEEPHQTTTLRDVVKKIDGLALEIYSNTEKVETKVTVEAAFPTYGPFGGIWFCPDKRGCPSEGFLICKTRGEDGRVILRYGRYDLRDAVNWLPVRPLNARPPRVELKVGDVLEGTGLLMASEPATVSGVWDGYVTFNQKGAVWPEDLDRISRLVAEGKLKRRTPQLSEEVLRLPSNGPRPSCV